MNKSILVVDDDAMIRRVVKAGLESIGHTVYELEEGSKVLKMVENEGIDIIILDIFMDGQEGMETAFELKDLHPDLPIIVISSDPVYVEMASHIADSVMNKPLNIELLRTQVEELTAV